MFSSMGYNNFRQLESCRQKLHFFRRFVEKLTTINKLTKGSVFLVVLARGD
jgi:hypothetical protein